MEASPIFQSKRRMHCKQKNKLRADGGAKDLREHQRINLWSLALMTGVLSFGTLERVSDGTYDQTNQSPQQRTTELLLSSAIEMIICLHQVKFPSSSQISNFGKSKKTRGQIFFSEPKIFIFARGALNSHISAKKTGKDRNGALVELLQC